MIWLIHDGKGNILPRGRQETVPCFFAKGVSVFLTTKKHLMNCQQKSIPLITKRWASRIGPTYPLRLTEIMNQYKPLPPRRMTYDNLQEEGAEPRKGKVASDGSVHLKQQVAAAAWLIASGT